MPSQQRRALCQVCSISPYCVVALDGFNFNDPKPKNKHGRAVGVALDCIGLDPEDRFQGVPRGPPRARPEPTQSPKYSVPGSQVPAEAQMEARNET